MITTTEFFIWFFEGLRGVGGWLIFLILSLFSIIYVVVNSSNRNLPASGWRLGVILVSLLIIPAGVLNFLPIDLQLKLLPYLEIIFYVGIIGGVIPFFIAIGYWLQFRGMIVCKKGHLYRKNLGECPECIPEDFAEHDPSELDETLLDIVDEGSSVVDTDPFAEAEIDETELAEREFFETEMGMVGLPKKIVPKASGFLLFAGEHFCQLNKGATTIGRGSGNDCVLQNTFISRNHAKIIEESKNLFRLYDLGSSNGTWLNGRKIMKATLLENDDSIRFGEEVTVIFLSSRKI
jgi:hypothetical protein